MAKKAEATESGKGQSRRGLIIQMLQEGQWTKPELAKKLFDMNPEWAVAKNKAAISGTVNDLKKRTSWTVKTSPKGIISLTAAKD